MTRWWLPVGLLALLLATAIPAIRHLRETPPPRPPPPATVRAMFYAPPSAEFGAGDDVLDAAISPDSAQAVFAATSDGAVMLWRRVFEQRAPEALAGTAGAAMPSWSPDQRTVLFFAQDKLRQFAFDDGSVRDLADATGPRGAAWLPDNSILFAPTGNGPIRRLRDGVETDETELGPGERGHVFPSAVGDRGDFLYIVLTDTGRRIVRLVSGDRAKDLTRTSGHAEVAGDYLVHVVEGTLSAQRLDLESFELTGRVTPLAFGVGVASSGRAFLASSSRVIAWAPPAPRARQLVWFDLQGRRLGTLGDPSDAWQVRLSPDDRRVAVTILDPLLRTLDIFVRPVAESVPPRRLSLSLSADTNPVWAPGSTDVVFRSLSDGRPTLLSRPFEYSEDDDTVVLDSELDEVASDWRGGSILFHAQGDGTGLDIWELEVASSGRRAVVRDAFNESDARWSPDGRWIAYASDEPGTPEIFVQPWPVDSEPIRATLAGGVRPRWTRDGRSLLFLRGDTLMRTTLREREDGLGFEDAEPVAELPGVRDYEAAHRSDRVLAITALSRPAPPTAHLIVDWVTGVDEQSDR